MLLGQAQTGLLRFINNFTTNSKVGKVKEISHYIRQSQETSPELGVVARTGNPSTWKRSA